jgi:ATP-dependent Clp protease ATP-binding subunit ClpB
MQHESYEDMRDAVTEMLRANFRPEFLNRVDEIIIFHALTKEEIEKIVEIQLAGLQRRLGARKLSIELTTVARAFLAEKGWDPVYGARPLKRAIQKNILDPLAMRVLQGEFADGDTVLVDRDGDHLTFRTASPEPIGV